LAAIKLWLKYFSKSPISNLQSHKFMSDEKNISTDTEAKAEVKEKVVKEKSAKPEDLKPGMTVRVYQKIKELNAKGEEKERLQFFDGMIIAKSTATSRARPLPSAKFPKAWAWKRFFRCALQPLTGLSSKNRPRSESPSCIICAASIKKIERKNGLG